MSNETRGWKRVVKTLSFLLFSLAILVLARGPGATQSEAEEVRPDEVLRMPELPEAQPAAEEVTLAEEVVEVAPGHITMDFKAADIHNVLRILSYKSGVNIVAGPEVVGKVTVRLVDVPWKKALEVILDTYDFGYEYDKENKIITITTMERLTEKKKAEKELAEVQPVVTKVFNLQYLDAGDAKKVLESQLSPRGKITALTQTGQRGWAFGAEEFGKRERVIKPEELARSKTLVISDIPPFLERVGKVIAEIDMKPQQVMIETRLVEVNRDRLKDLGLDFGTGSGGWSAIDLGSSGGYTQITGKSETMTETPSGFGPKATGISGTYSSTTPFDAGLTLLFQKLTGTQYQVILHALEEDVEANTLSAPRIMTLNNQEATILVGTKYPILKGEVEEGVVTTSLDYYQDIGIQLNVVPQISGEDQINMIVHPAVTSYTTTLKAYSASEGTSYVTGEYPVILTREVETQILMKDGETIVIGGLLKDVKSEARIGVPILSKIPILGLLFQRKVTDIEKIDLLIFITAHIVKPGEYLAAEVPGFEEMNPVEEEKVEKRRIERKRRDRR